MAKEDVVHIYIGIHSAGKMNKMMLFAATWMQLEVIIPSEVSKKDKAKYHMVSLIRGI